MIDLEGSSKNENKKYLIGIDSSLACTGLAILSDTPRLSVLKTKKIFTQKDGENLLQRYNEIINNILVEIEPYIKDVKFISIEQPNTARNLREARKLIGLYQIIRLTIYNKYNIEPIEVNTKSAKKMLGDGNADKEKTVKLINKILKTKFKYHNTNKEISDDDICDAISVAYFTHKGGQNAAVRKKINRKTKPSSSRFS